MCLIAAALAAPAPQAAGAKCTQAQAHLTKGIQQNLDIQAQELKGVQTLQVMEKAGTAQAAAFQKEQKSVLSIQQQGIAIRANNQKLAKEINSPAASGLDIVAKAQVKEKDQVTGLKGNAADATTLALLVQEVQDGTKQNQMNLAAAKSQKCAK
ncbi:hypothetical protein GQ44DRAFT_622830 [Phaeosphaeriaceae sp. PMI808]|nr:hypothetical protein GQ44DRAFT_622830 [Phaeosphaeriaceae sp. PMI808]